MRHFQWTENLVAINGEEFNWVVDGPGVNSQQIEKQTLSFEDKAW